ncbi:hypothetical protein [Citrobacter sp. RHB21-C01]|uniref:hypothetical protein n=1 Tax=Citrobacter sp. RHB21-C01 TaxID=2742622 RepID=UPI0034D4AC87
MRNFRWWLVFSNALLMSQSALAAVNTEVTRVVFNAGDERYSLGLANSLQQTLFAGAGELAATACAGAGLDG